MDKYTAGVCRSVALFAKRFLATSFHVGGTDGNAGVQSKHGTSIAIGISCPVFANIMY